MLSRVVVFCKRKTNKVMRFLSCGILDESHPSTPLRDPSPADESILRGKGVASKSTDKLFSKGMKSSTLQMKLTMKVMPLLVMALQILTDKKGTGRLGDQTNLED
ncbi:hypothetical protein ACH5RR_023524 [Cinchona calisaya]|uniref:Uncharacterized protein n=1 Tax=Cinchona calisaya TaxID=153742 RepID=A0ABD2ZE21_9GENT